MTEQITYDCDKELEKLCANWAKRKKKEKWLLPVRILIFPVALIVKLFKWTYGY